MRGSAGEWKVRAVGILICSLQAYYDFDSSYTLAPPCPQPTSSCSKLLLPPGSAGMTPSSCFFRPFQVTAPCCCWSLGDSLYLLLPLDQLLPLFIVPRVNFLQGSIFPWCWYMEERQGEGIQRKQHSLMWSDNGVEMREAQRQAWEWRWGLIMRVCPVQSGLHPVGCGIHW